MGKRNKTEEELWVICEREAKRLVEAMGWNKEVVREVTHTYFLGLTHGIGLTLLTGLSAYKQFGPCPAVRSIGDGALARLSKGWGIPQAQLRKLDRRLPFNRDFPPVAYPN